MTTLYKINGQFITWDAAHNIHGYTTTATEVVVSGYACVSPWGDDSGMGGYLDRHSSDNIFEWEFWIDDEETWRGIDALATEFGLYPASCIDTELTNGISVSPAVYFENLDEVWYLIRDAVGLGWIEENDLENNGWYHVDDTSYEFILFDTTTGKVSYGVESLSEMEFVEAGYFTISDGGEVVFVEQSPFPVVCTYAVEFSPTETVADGDSLDTELPYYASKLYLPMAVVNTDPWVEYYGWDVSEEQPPAPVLPTVTLRSSIYISPDSYNHQIGSGNSAYLYEYYNGSYRGILYDDATKKQCVYGWRYYPTGGPWQKFYYGVSAVNMSGNSLGVRNDTQNTINVTYILYAESSDPATTIITVYNSSNVAYNAFKYTANGTDYYYVLDGTQTDWTDDLASIGYHLPAYEEISLYFTGGSTAFQRGVTSGYSGDPGSGYTKWVYTDSGMNQSAMYDSTKRYELGYYNNGEWVLNSIQSVSDMPSSTSSHSTGGWILYGTSAGYMKVWFISNTPDDPSTLYINIGNSPFEQKVRVYTVS